MTDARPQPDRAPRAPSRLRRWVLAAVAAIALAAGWGAYKVTRPESLAAIILPRASEALGGTVSASQISLTGLNEITLEGLTVRADGWPGEAGELVRADSVSIRFALLPLLVGELRVRSVRAPDLLLRLTEKESSRGDFSVMSLGCWQRPGSEGAAFVRPDMISIEHLRIENGTLARGKYRRIGDIGLRGEITPSPASDTAMKVSLVGRGNSIGALLVREIRGEVDPMRRSAKVEVEELRLAEKELPVAPLIVRDWLRQVGFEGVIARATFSYAPDAPPSATIDLEDLALNLSLGAIGGEELARGWSGFTDGTTVEIKAMPRMKLSKGTLRISPDEVRFDSVQGELGAEDPQNLVRPVPFEGFFSMRLPKNGLESFEWDKRTEWVEKIAQTAPFSGEIEIKDFASSEGDTQRVLYLPSAVTRILSDFTATQWKIQLHAGFERGEPAPSGEPAAVRSSGSLTISEGVGSFVEFPYRLDGVEGVFEYADDDLRVVSVTGRGSEGALVTISGDLKGLSSGAEIDLLIQCAKAPIDDRLLDAFADAPRRALSLLFDRKMMKSLSDARLLPGADTFPEIRNQLASLGNHPGKEAERARLERALEAGSFDLAGTCRLEIRVYSAPGFGEPVEVSGTVSEINAGVLFSRFPYPLRLREGRVDISDEAIDLGEAGIVAITPAGGILTVGGSIEIPRLADGERGLITNITIRDIDDAVNPALLAAIPHPDGDERGNPPEGWPGKESSEAAKFLAALGLRGGVNFTGTVKTRADGDDDFEVDLEFAGGLAQPDEAGRALLAANGLPWPPEFGLVDCEAKVQISPRAVRLVEFAGRNGGGSVRGDGSIDTQGPNRRINLSFDDLPVGRAFEGFLSDDKAEAERLFKEFAPAGTITGSIARIVDASGARTAGSLVPNNLEVTLAGSRVRAKRVGGVLGVSESGLRAEALRFSLESAGEPDGALVLAGPLEGTRTDAAPLEVSLEVSLESTRVESPIVRYLLATRATGVLDLLRSRSATGRFSARYASGATDILSIRPESLEIGEPDARVGLAFRPSSEIRSEGARTSFAVSADLVGASPGASAGTLDVTGAFAGATEPSKANELTGAFKLEAESLAPALRRQLPPPFDLAGQYTDLTTTGRFTLDLPDISLVWPSDGSAAEPDLYQLAKGEMTFRGAAFSAGTRISEADGALALQAFRYRPKVSNAMELSSALRLAHGRVFDRPFGASEATIDADRGGDALVVAASGDIAFGRFDVDARIELKDERYAMRARVADADFEVLRSAAPLTASTERGTGRLTGFVTVEGSTTGSVDARTGKGRVVIRNANLASLPFAMRALQLTQLMLPLTSTVSASQALFEIQGNTAIVKSCTLAAGTIDLEGSGTIDIPTFGLGLRLFAKGTVPIVSDVIGGVTSSIFAIDIGGTLAEPKASLAPLPGMSDAPVPPKSAEPEGSAAVPPAEEPKKP